MNENKVELMEDRIAAAYIAHKQSTSEWSKNYWNNVLQALLRRARRNEN